MKVDKLLIASLLTASVVYAQTGSELFQKNCAVCHFNAVWCL